jgi:hypothetical protein
MEYIKAKTADDWICVCGNEPWQAGFYPCDRRGNHVEPTVKDWTGIYYVCDKCGRIIDQRNRRVVGRCPESVKAKLKS